MAQIPMLAQESAFYKLIGGAMNAERGYKSLEEFYTKEFDTYFKNSEWRNILDVGDENPTGEIRQVIGGVNVPVMAAYTADDGDAPKIGNEGFEIKSLNVLKSKLSYAFNEKSFEDGQRLMNYGATQFNTKSIFNSFLKDNVNLIGGINVLRSYSAYQMECLGKLTTTADNKAGGMVGILIDYSVPAGNRKKAGFGQATKKAWSDPAAKPIQDLIDLHKLSDKLDGVFRMSEATWDLLKASLDTQKRVGAWASNGLQTYASITSYEVYDDQLQKYLTTVLKLPKVEYVNWKAKSLVLDPNTQELKFKGLPAFEDNIVLLRPQGKAGIYDWKRPVNLFSTSSDPAYFAEGGMTMVQQLNSAKNKSAEFIAEAQGLPVPYNVREWFYLKTNEAAS